MLAQKYDYWFLNWNQLLLSHISITGALLPDAANSKYVIHPALPSLAVGLLLNDPTCVHRSDQGSSDSEHYASQYKMSVTFAALKCPSCS